eukprot:CAMPEP_0170135698 /NCGR_PEP_ID=MMETSP0033_2-20121228/2611_1 /TAXON_ID=195969 /ORGANISM="Dolichomastix tenuilepis, Strain CCMP3274" /LENGTH=254 /DNA_ID=CAMNT_0010371301 /DNA_START=28 /DNA_END=792 /DNA_ORIENTATION=+
MSSSRRQDMRVKSEEERDFQHPPQVPLPPGKRYCEGYSRTGVFFDPGNLAKLQEVIDNSPEENPDPNVSPPGLGTIPGKVYRYEMEAPGGRDRAEDGPNSHKLWEPEPLHQAAFKGQLDVVQRLVEAEGVDIDGKDGGGHTAVHYASGFGRHAVLEYLMAQGANIEIRDMWGKCCIDWAVQGEQARCIEMLRAEAEKRNIVGGRGEGAPLITFIEYYYGLTQAEMNYHMDQAHEKMQETAEQRRARRKAKQGKA